METSSNNKQENALFKKYLEGNCTAKEKEYLENWYQSFDQAALPKTEVEKRSLKKIRQHVAAQLGITLEPQTHSLFPAIMWKAAVLLLIASATIFGVYKYNTIKQQTILEYASYPNKPRIIQLPDGSKVTLNLGTKLKLLQNFNEKSRDVELSGEAFFEVAKDKNKPFRIRSGELMTEVLGTSFNINSYPENAQLKVAVKTGRVKVAQISSTPVPKDLAVMEKDQVLTYDRNTKRSTVQSGDPKLMSSWINGELYIDNANYKAIANQLARHYQIEVILDQSLENQGDFTLNMGKESLDSSIGALSALTGQNFTIKNQKLFIMKK